MAMTEVPTLDLRRRRILEIRHHKIEEKRLKIQTLQKEMSELNEDIPLKTSLENKNVASETSEESSSVVVFSVGNPGINTSPEVRMILPSLVLMSMLLSERKDRLSLVALRSRPLFPSILR